MSQVSAEKNPSPSGGNSSAAFLIWGTDMAWGKLKLSLCPMNKNPSEHMNQGLPTGLGV